MNIKNKPCYFQKKLFIRGLKVLQENPSLFLNGIFKVLRPFPKPYRSIYKQTLKTWMIQHQEIAFSGACKWMGIPTLKNPLDAWIYQELLFDVRPELIIEIGAFKGGSTLFLAQIQEMLQIKGAQIISIDISHQDFIAKHPSIYCITGNSGDMNVIARVQELAKNKKTLIIHDGDHSSSAVFQDLINYHTLVTAGSYFIIEDGINDLFRPGDRIGRVEDGPLVAIDKFLSQYSHFKKDLSRERYGMTYNHNGYLQRIY